MTIINYSPIPLPKDPVYIWDISHWDEDEKSKPMRLINWDMVKQDPKKIRVVVCKVGEGYAEGYTPLQYPRNYDLLKSKGFIIGGYEYGHIGLPAALQGAYIRKRINGREPDLPLCLDLEDKDICPPQPIPTKDTINVRTTANLVYKVFNACVDLLNAMDDAQGRETAYYTGNWWINWILTGAWLIGLDITKITNRKLWGADYTPPWELPFGVDASRAWIWQITDRSPIVGGVNKTGDMSVYLGTWEQLLSDAGKGPKPPEGLTLESLDKRTGILEIAALSHGWDLNGVG